MVSKVKLFACVGAVACLALSPACKKDGGDSAKSGGLGTKATKKAAASALSYMPANAKAVLGVNIAAAMNAPVLAKYKDMMMKKMNAEITDVQKECGLDIAKDITSITFGFVGKQEVVAVVTGDFDQKKAEGCLIAAAKKDGKEIKMTDDGKFRVYSNGNDDPKPLVVYWADNSAIITQQESKSLLTEVINGKKLGDGSVMSLIKSTKTSASMWFAGDPGAMGADVPAQGINGVAGTINVDKTIDVKALVNFTDESKAKDANNTMSMGLMMVKGQAMAKPFLPIIEKLKVEQDGKAIKIGISLTSDDLTTIEKAIGPMLMR